VPFLVTARTTSYNDPNDVLAGVTVAASLIPANATSLLNCSAAARKAAQQNRCTIKSGEPPGKSSCMMQLPCAANFLLKACAVAYANGTAVPSATPGQPPCWEFPIGRSNVDWASKPWTAHPGLDITLDKTNYTWGSKAVLTFVTLAYFGQMSGLLAYGNFDTQYHRVLSNISPGTQQLTIGPLGDECSDGCSAVVVLSVGRRPTQFKGKLPSVPISKLFDPLGPMTVAASTRINVIKHNTERQRLDVSVSVEGSHGLRTRTGNNAVTAPFGSATITVKALDKENGRPAVGAEVRL